MESQGRGSLSKNIRKQSIMLEHVDAGHVRTWVRRPMSNAIVSTMTQMVKAHFFISIASFRVRQRIQKAGEQKSM